ncbi:MAG: DegV family protein [Actinomycetota bacterium]
MSVRIVTDSGSDLSIELADQLGVVVVPLSIRFGSDEYTDRVQLTPEQFYAEMDSNDELPETAAPAPGAFLEAFNGLIADGATDIVCINLSFALSATFQSAQTAADQIEGTNVTIVDSKSATVGQGMVVRRAAEAAASGSSAAEVIALAEDLADRMHVLGVLDTLDNLKKGGRIGNAQAMLGSMLSIKPCIDLSSGEVEEAGRQRTRKKALAWLAAQIPDGATNIAVGHAMAADVEKFLDLTDNEIADISLIGPVVGTHGGPGVIGLAYTD